MRQICPQCQKMVELPDDAIEAPCPACQAIVKVPQTYAVAVDPMVVKPAAPPPAPLPPPVPPVVLIPTPTQSQTVIPPDPNRPPPPPGFALPTQSFVTLGQGYTSAFPIAISPTVVPWVIAVGFVLIFLLMPFPWSGCYPGGSSAYTQSYWGSLGNSLTSDIIFEQELKQETALKLAARSDWWLLLPYLLTVLVGGGLAWADRLIHAADFAYRIGPMGTLRAMVWPRRTMIVAGLVGASLLFFSLASFRGFGLEAAVRSVTSAKYADDLSKVDNSADRERVKARIGIEQAKYGVAAGYAWWLVGLTHLAMAGAAGLHLWLDQRGSAPAPRIVAEW